MKDSVDSLNESADTKTRKMHPNSLRNLKPGGGRVRGSKNRSTLISEALMRAKIAEVPRKIRDEYLDVIASQELMQLILRARKEEVKLGAIREGFDRTRGKPPVSVEMESKSQQITGTLTDLLFLLQQVQALPPPETGDAIEANSAEAGKPEEKTCRP